MQSSPWIAILKKIPRERLGKFALRTTNGTEIVIQDVLMLEGDCLALRGRMSGDQDTSRLFLVPYDQIDFLTSMNAVKEAEFQEWFGASALSPSQQGTTPKEPESNGNEQGSGLRRLNERQSVLLDRVRARAKK